MYDLLVQYRDREGHSDVPQRHEEDGEKLGRWLMNQRRAHTTGKLEADREKQLNSIGVSWGLRSDRWDQMYDLLVQFNKREGHPNAPARYEEDGKNLGYWLANQRQSRKKGTLQADRFEKLDNLGVAWQAKATA